MKNKVNIIVFALLVIAASLYRVWDGRPWGFAPQIAMALFAGSIIKDKKLSFLLPLLSMFISDLLYEILFRQGLTPISGFYNGQWINYILLISVTAFGFFINPNKLTQIFMGSLGGVLFYFITSNFISWLSGLDINNQPYAKTWQGLIYCYTAALPFLKNSFLSTVLFSGVFFGIYQLYINSIKKLAIN